jgi:Siphovirus ReqiPepy6 Gp37-like protein
MDFFKFNPTGEQTFLENGELINNITSSMWVERYADLGEFSFEALLSSGIRENLPKGTLISHINTLEVMIVENHEIKETVDEDPSVTVTGRSFPSFLENRIVGTNDARGGSTIISYKIPALHSWEQMVQLINDHIVYVTSPGDALANITARHTIPFGTVGESTERTINRGTVWERVAELLKVDSLGIKTVRRNEFNGVDTPNTDLVIYKGEDKSDKVLFSWKSGELDTANYLFSQKNDKNSAMVVGQYIWVVVDTGPDKYDRRMMIVDASDIDGNYGGVPSGGDLFDLSTAMATRGLQALANQNDTNISQADISKTTRYQYRLDYNLGDLVTLDGNFNQSDVRRVVEYAEIEDENGESGHPTLELPTTEG